MRFFGGQCRTKNTMLSYIMSDNCEILRVIRRNRFLDLGNGSNKFGNHCFIRYVFLLCHSKYSFVQVAVWQ